LGDIIRGLKNPEHLRQFLELLLVPSHNKRSTFSYMFIRETKSPTSVGDENDNE
jgi:hypothetical protein